MAAGGHTAGREDRAALGALLERVSREAARAGETAACGTLAALARRTLSGAGGTAALDELAALLT
ncbi:hypothetical protein GTY57_09220, partial [Streptomyces sp. SID5475]|nr:hypothetical protein [Streptomyces sp. SID5475]